MSVVNRCLKAASQGDIVTLNQLRQQIDLAKCFDKYSATPLHYAARAGRMKCVEWLVEEAKLSGTKPADNGATPAHDAAATGQLKCLQWLMESGRCSETGRDNCGATPLHLGKAINS